MIHLVSSIIPHADSVRIHASRLSTIFLPPGVKDGREPFSLQASTSLCQAAQNMYQLRKATTRDGRAWQHSMRKAGHGELRACDSWKSRLPRHARIGRRPYSTISPHNICDSGEGSCRGDSVKLLRRRAVCMQTMKKRF